MSSPLKRKLAAVIVFTSQGIERWKLDNNSKKWSEGSLPVNFDDAWQKGGTEVAYHSLTKRTSDSVQIDSICWDKSLNTPVNPNNDISEGTSKVKVWSFESGILKRHEKPLEPNNTDEGLKQIAMFFTPLSKPFLIGHNIKTFNIPILIYKNLILWKKVSRIKFQVLFTILNYRRKMFEKSAVLNYKQDTLIKYL